MKRLNLLLVACIAVTVLLTATNPSIASPEQLILSLSIPDTARVVDYDNGIYVVGTTTGYLYILNEAGEYTSTPLSSWLIRDVRIENGFIAVASEYEVIMLSLPLGSLTPTELWRRTPGAWYVASVDLSSDGAYVAYLACSHSVGVYANDGTLVASYSIAGSWIAWWLDATDDMEYIAITAEVGPYYGGVNTGVELYRFDGTSLQKMWGRILIYNYETTEVRVSEAKDYVAVATSSGTFMNLLNLSTGEVLWQYETPGKEQFACDGDDDLNYVIGGTQAWATPYKYFILKNLGTAGYELLTEGDMAGAVNDLDSTPDASYFAFGSDAGEFILVGRTDDSIEPVFNVAGLPLIDAIEIGSTTLLVGGGSSPGFINLYSFVIRYYLTVETDPPGLVPAPTPPSDWYDESTYVTLTAPSISFLDTVRYVFKYWDVDGTQVAGNPITVHMDANHAATAHYSIPVGGVWVPINKFQLLAPWISLASLITVATVSIVYVKRRKKQQT